MVNPRAYTSLAYDLGFARNSSGALQATVIAVLPLPVDAAVMVLDLFFTSDMPKSHMRTDRSSASRQLSAFHVTVHDVDVAHVKVRYARRGLCGNAC